MENSLLTPIVKYMRDHPYLSWADIEEVDEDDLLKYGFKVALHRAYARSERLASSGMSNTMGRAEREEHYRRKGQHEELKEAARRAQWLAEFPGAPESAWERREAFRQRRKQNERNTRRVQKGKPLYTAPPTKSVRAKTVATNTRKARAQPVATNTHKGTRKYSRTGGGAGGRRSSSGSRKRK